MAVHGVCSSASCSQWTMIWDGFYNTNENFYFVNKAAASSSKHMCYDTTRIHSSDSLDWQSYFPKSYMKRQNSCVVKVEVNIRPRLPETNSRVLHICIYASSNGTFNESFNATRELNQRRVTSFLFTSKLFISESPKYH